MKKPRSVPIVTISLLAVGAILLALKIAGRVVTIDSQHLDLALRYMSVGKEGRIAILDRDVSLQLFSRQDGSAAGSHRFESPPLVVAAAADSPRVYRVICDDGAVIELDSETKRRTQLLPPLAPPDFFSDARFAKDGSTAAMWVSAKQLRVYRMSPPGLLVSAPVEEGKEIQFFLSENGSLLGVLTRNTRGITFSAWDTLRGVEVFHRHYPRDSPFSTFRGRATFSPDGTRAYWLTDNAVEELSLPEGYRRTLSLGIDDPFFLDVGPEFGIVCSRLSRFSIFDVDSFTITHSKHYDYWAHPPLHGSCDWNTGEFTLVSGGGCLYTGTIRLDRLRRLRDAKK
jgi:hypothetical protein